VVKLSVGAKQMQVLHPLLHGMQEEQHGIGLNITTRFSPAKQLLPDMTRDMWETQILSGEAKGSQGFPMAELLDTVFGYQDLSLSVRYLVCFFQLTF